MNDEQIQSGERISGKIRKIVLNRSKCVGAQACVAVAPGVFQMDDKNLAYIVDPKDADDDTVLLSAQACPVLAIEIFDEENKKIFPED